MATNSVRDAIVSLPRVALLAEFVYIQFNLIETREHLDSFRAHVYRFLRYDRQPIDLERHRYNRFFHYSDSCDLIMCGDQCP